MFLLSVALKRSQYLIFFPRNFTETYSEVVTNFYFLPLTNCVGAVLVKGDCPLKNSKLCRHTPLGCTFEAQHSLCAKRKSELGEGLHARTSTSIV